MCLQHKNVSKIALLFDGV